MEVTAHRGFGEAYPENTVKAAERAGELADRVEIDVRRCGSGELVASHFDRVRVVSDGTGRVRNLSVGELAALSVQGSDEGIRELEDVAAAVPSDTAIAFDLKQPGVASDTIGLAERIDNDVVVASFYADALWEARDVDSGIPLSYHFDVRLDRNMTTARLLDCEYVSPHWSLALGTDVVDRAHDEGMKVEPWAVASSAVADFLGTEGVDSLAVTSPTLTPDDVGRLERARVLTEVSSVLERLRGLGR
ncbi:glycerophosphodiester phosphodiesterase [Halobium salinum]|uniref:Glycerophosphodiester phosphodiesterase n=1 Tax=Halobium salinum TaxID=1364940 RepID=A0ABD5P8K0_9EURY|nr:glycerophosphodiester phosphodiesterase [Halobium salinum]